jgi:hypothetical protein
MLEDHNGFIGDIDVEKVAVFIGDTGAKVFADTAVPGSPKSLVHMVLDGYNKLDIKIP